MSSRRRCFSRRDAALTAREPIDAEAAEKRVQLEAKQNDFRARKKAGAAPATLEKLEAAIDELAREVRDLDAKAQDIEFAIDDIKAVNPNAKREEDTRTPAELLLSIARHGTEADSALAELAQLVKS